MPGKPERGFAVNTDYNVIISDEAVRDLRRYIDYLINVKQNLQAALNVMDDYDDTVDALSKVAGSLKMCDSPNMKKRSLRRINFFRHNYFMLFRVDGQNAYVTNIFHGLEDADNKMR